MNIAFYVSGNAGRLNKILDLDDPAVEASIKLVFSDANTTDYLKERIERLGASYYRLNFSDIPKTPDRSRGRELSDAILEQLRQFQIDYCFSFGGHILSGALLEAYENRIINFHPAILPLFPGVKAIEQAVTAGAHLLGNTAHFVDAGVDTGAVIMQNVVSSKIFEEGGYDAVLNQQLPMFLQIFRWLKAGRLRIIDGKAVIDGADYRRSVFFPALE
jgi:phosphoribosylglycinamide formyltransferase-1